MNNHEPDKYLILSASYGEGHNQVAKAIGESIDHMLSDAEPIIIDVMKVIHHYSYPVSHFIYKKGIKRFPDFYSFLYRKTHDKNSFSVKLNSFFLLGMKTVLKIIQETKPKVVVSTYPFAAGIISKLKEQGLIDIPSVTIITDFTNHSYWIYPYTDYYVVGSTDVRDGLVALGIEQHKIMHTGIPVREKFNDVPSKDSLTRKYEMNSKLFTILIMGGGDGFFSKDFSTLRLLDSISVPIQIFIVCGKNNRLKRQLEMDLKNTKHDVRIFGYCDSIHELMALSDLMITKPGGVSISEAMTLDLPLLIVHCLPGQEEENMEFLQRSGYAFVAKSEHEMCKRINLLIQDPEPLKWMRRRMHNDQSKTSTRDALQVIVEAENCVRTTHSGNRITLQKQLEWS